MDSLRIARMDGTPSMLPCCRCAGAERRWDRIADKAYCPNCQELVVVGEAPPLVEKTHHNRCAVCDRLGTVCYQTLPLQSPAAVEIDLCAEHLRAFVARRLGPQAFHQLRRRLNSLGIAAEQVFLLHGAFYDSQGRALQPANEAA